MRTLFIVFLLFAFFGSARVYGQELPKSPVITVPTGCWWCVPRVAVPMAPPIIYQPQIIYQPYQYQGTQIQPRYYHTPLRDALFGRYRINHYYAPVAPQPQVAQ